MSTSPLETLELRALEQRNRLHRTAAELKAKTAAAREKLDMAKNAREHLLAGSIIVSLLGLLSGYAFAGMFTRH